MKPSIPERKILEMFAELLEYPCGDEKGTAAALAAALSGRRPAAALLGKVHSFLAGASGGQAEEIFTATFDLQAVCTPYVGFHLFGEGHKRRLFLAGMNALYASRGFEVGRELPDHIAVVLRFLAVSAAEVEAREIVQDALVPALSKMLGKFGDGANPYGNVLRALHAVLLAAQPIASTEAPPGRPATEVGTP